MPPDEIDSRPGDYTEAAYRETSHGQATSASQSSGIPIPERNGYANAYTLYAQKGWVGILKIAASSKFPPPAGFTGRDGVDPSEDVLRRWASDEPDGNLALRLPPGVIGIDVDAYGDKTGGQTLIEAERRWGALPITAISTSRDDAVSGIRLFRVPSDAELEGVIRFNNHGIGDIEICQHHHRYVMCWPSLHPEGRQYHWLTPDGTEMPVEEIPGPQELPDLPDQWLRALIKKPPNRNGQIPAARTRVDRAVADDLVEQALTAGAPSGRVAKSLGNAVARLRGAGCRHDEARDSVASLLSLGATGEPGVRQALAVLGDVFIDATAGSRQGGEDEAREEFLRFISGNGMASILAEQLSRASERDFWKRDNHQHINEFARARQVSPWSTMGAVLAHAMARIPPHMALPPYVGGSGSLNLIVAQVGASAAGKDASEAAARAAINYGDFLTEPEVVPLGSGEGMAATFRPPTLKPEDPHFVTAAIFTAPEIDTLMALATRSGSTLTGEIRKVYSGQTLGQGNAARMTRRVVPEHSYRACVILGVQPLRSGPLLDAADGGLPQRVLWMPASDPGAPDTPPHSPGTRRIVLPEWPNPPEGGRLIDFEVSTPLPWQQITANRRAVLRGESSLDPVDGHALFTRFKVSAGLAVLDGRIVITDEDWHFAGLVMEISDRTRARCRTALADRAQHVNRARALVVADRDEVIGERKLQRCRGAILRWVHAQGRIPRAALRKKVKHELRPFFDEAIGELLEEGLVQEVELGHHGRGYTPGTPVHPRTPPLS